MNTILLVIFTIIALGAIYYIILISKSKISNPNQASSEDFMRLAEERFRQIATETLERVEEKLNSKIQLNNKDLESKKDNIFTALQNIKEIMDQNSARFSKNDETMAVLKSTIEQHQKVTSTLSDKTENLSKIFSNNQLRGELGQKVAEDLLKASGLVKGKNFNTQVHQASSNSIPDLTILFPDGAKLNIDVKFPFQALSRYQQTNDESQKNIELAQFKTDVKTKIKEISSRDYINPAEKTLNFVIMFIPTEVVFGFISDKFDDLVNEAYQKGVVMCGPFGFMAIIRMVQQAYDNFAYQQNLHQIISYVKEFEAEYTKFSEGLDTLGTRLDSTKKQFDIVAMTRTNALGRVIGKIKKEEPQQLKQNDLIN